jgi:hypothetical protein
MRISTNTPELLLLQYRPVWAPLFFGLFALLFIVMAWSARTDAPGISLAMLLPAAMLLLGVWMSFINCTAEFSATVRVVTIRERGLFRSATRTVRIDCIRDVFADSSGSQNSHTGERTRRAYRPALTVRGEQRSVPLSPVYRTGDSARQVVAVVETWLTQARRVR